MGTQDLRLDPEGRTASLECHGPRDLTYRGQDRRSPIAGVPPLGRQLRLAVALLLVVTAVVAYLAATTDRPTGVDLRGLNVVLATACVVLALVAGFVSCLRWRMSGNASSLRIGVAFVLFSVLGVTVALVPFLWSNAASHDLLAELDAAMWITIVGLLVVAVVAPPINTRTSAVRLTLGLAASIGVLVAVAHLWPGLADASRSTVAPVVGIGEITAHALVIAVWTLLALISLARGVRRASWLWAWLGLMLLGFAVAGALSALAVDHDDLWSTGAQTIRMLALLFALNGVGQELKLAFLEQRSRLFDTRLSVAADELRRRAEQAEREERAHETRSALLGIQAATRTLAAGYATETQSELRDALEAEIALLRRLVDDERSDAPCRPFDVAAAVSPVVACKRAVGREVRADVAPGIRAVGRASVVTEVVQTLLDNASEHAPGSPVLVRAVHIGDRVSIRVEDRGPGVTREQRERIFGRGVSSCGAGRGLGLYVACRLLRDQDGDLHVEDREDGGAAFVVTLPAASLRLRAVAGAELVHEPDHAGELWQTDPLDAEGGHQ